ncbi:sensor histidine kinase [Nocardioides sp. Kera G14]|uniref:sensor histidine kinase n=1 Tax=Nocardioides sp. Kera G14 TaxID=2884264 RepID=UPI001D0F53E8|nr:sensor histidine kinase [Nocardioides sp. Kera G14]UDY22527.1 sensor histidine kinase [Nocardioides sp. Kera G14]
MPITVSDRLPYRAALVVRAVALLALGAPVLWARDTAGIFGLITTGIVWLMATVLEFRGRLPLVATVIGDALLVGAICGVAVGTAPIVLGGVAVPPFTAALFLGPAGVARVLVCEVGTLFATAWLVNRDFTAEQGYAAFSWFVVGLGVGLVGCFIYAVLQERRTPLAPYHYAQGLLRQLIDLSDGLESGLNAITLGGQLLWSVRERLPSTAIALYTPRGHGLTALVGKTLDGNLTSLEDVARRAFASGHRIREFPIVALPLRAGSDVTVILVAELTSGLKTSGLISDAKLDVLIEELHPLIVQLDTALLFAAFRERASTEERRRLAREMHDGVAQDIASLGYLVDAIAGDSTVERQQDRIAILRERLTAIVAEVRRSLVNLRTDIGESESLGAAIATLARSLSESSGVAIHVTADETTDRLRPEVEAELFRIVQESINNALKHAEATEIEVHCQVRAPEAHIVICDNGRGMGDPRDDSYGLTIMRERAALIDATLEFGTSPTGGVQVSVILHGDGGNLPPEVTVVGSPFESETRVGA